LQRFPHAPQWLKSDESSTQVPSQEVRPAAQHAPFEQVCPDGHTRPQAPQLAVLLCSATQVPPQLVWSGPQHRPLEQWSSHATPHPPQLVLSNCVSMHLPLQNVCPGGQITHAPLNAVNPVLQVKPQAKPPQVAVAKVGTGHGEHAVPQLAVLVLAAQAPPQAWNPVLQVKPQEVPLHVATPLAGTGHGAHAAPQVARLTLVTHTPPQSWKPALHTDPHPLKPPQTAVAFARDGHTLPQLPQWFGSVPRSTQNPLQSRPLPLHDSEQRPPEQYCPAGHALPHAPQWFGSMSGRAIHTLPHRNWPASQGWHAPATRKKPWLQENPHCPSMPHCAMPLAGTGQGEHPLPQWLMSRLKTHCPLHRWVLFLHRAPQVPPVQVASPPLVTSGPQLVHEVPQYPGSVSAKQFPPHR
jgi:hypothetical protein